MNFIMTRKVILKDSIIFLFFGISFDFFRESGKIYSVERMCNIYLIDLIKEGAMLKKYFKKREEKRRKAEEMRRQAIDYQELFEGYDRSRRYPVRLLRHERDLIELEFMNTGKSIGYHRFTDTDRVAAYGRGLTDEEMKSFVIFSQMFLGAEIEEEAPNGRFIIFKEVSECPEEAIHESR